MSHFDTIVAPITGPGTAAVAVVRLSGPEAWSVASRVFSPWNPSALKASYGRFSNGDDGLALPFAEGHSYTGEETVELSLHGSFASVRSLVERCIASGARMAEPGEFTQRAFLNGRIDLTQAEGIRDTIEAQTEAQLRLANRQREGSLRRRIEGIRESVARILAAVEASVDFSEEIGELDRPAAAARARELIGEIEGLLETACFSRLLRRGLRVAIVGPPNSGKSSLLNAILGSERAIVTDIPGTTRDFVEEQIEVEGFPVVLIDTAGLRDSDDRVESIGIQRSRAIAAAADVVWYVTDASLEEREVPDHAVWVVNKIDLAPGYRGPGRPISALTGAGLPELVRSLPIDRDFGHRDVAIDARHAPSLDAARQALLETVASLESDLPEDLVSVLLQDALHALGQVVGDTASPDMIHRIFADFCIGK